MDEKTALLRGTTVQSESSESETDVIEQDNQVTKVESDTDKGVEIDMEDDGDTESGLPEWLPAKFITDGEPNYEALAKSYASLEKKLSEKGVSKPGSADEYEYEFKILNVDEESFGSLKEQALEKGFSTEQFQFMLESSEQALAESLIGLLGTPESSSEYLTEKWGKDFEKNLSAAERAFSTYMPDSEDVDALRNHPGFIQIMAAVGKELGEDSQPVKKAGSKVSLTKTEVQELMNSDEYWNPESAAYRKVQKYFEAGGEL